MTDVNKTLIREDKHDKQKQTFGSQGERFAEHDHLFKGAARNP